MSTPKRRKPAKPVAEQRKPAKAKSRPPVRPTRKNGRLRAHGLKFTEETKVRILARIRNGEIRELAAEAAGIGDRTLVRWMARGRDELETWQAQVEAGDDPGDLPEFATFYLDVVENEALALGEDAKVIRDASRGGDVAAAQWRLTKHRPAQYGERSRLQITTGDEVEVDAVGALLGKLAQIEINLGLIADPSKAEDDGGDGPADR